MKPVEIHWLDSIGSKNASWFDDDFLDDLDCLVESFCWLIRETDDAYIVTAHIGVGGSVHSPMKIPKTAVVDIWEFDTTK